MGRIIAKRIRGMNWMAKVSLVLIFTLVFSTFMYQGWYKPKQAQATNVAVLDAWPGTPQLTATTGNPTGSFTISTTASNRLLVVAVGIVDAANTAWTVSATYGGKALTQIAAPQAQRRTAWIGYLNEADIASRSDDTVTVTIGGAHTDARVYIASYSGVDQTTPATGTSVYCNNAGTVALGSLTAGAGGTGYRAYIWAGTTAVTRTSDTETFTEHSDLTNQGTILTLGMASKSIAASTASNPTVTWSAATRSSVASIMVNGATVSSVNVGDGTDPANYGVVAGDTAKVADGFTMATDAGTEEVTAVTASLTGNTNVSSIKLYRDAGTIGILDGGETLLSTVNSPGAAVTFSSLTESLTTTATNYLMVVDIAGGATTGNTVVATVTDITVTGPAVKGTVTDSGATLTISVNNILTVGDGTAPSAKNVYRGDTNRTVSEFTLSVNTGSTVVTQVAVADAGSAAAATATTAAKIWEDTGSTPHEWDAGDTLVASTTFSGETATFTGLSIPVTSGSTDVYIVTYDISATATAAQTLNGAATVSSASLTTTNNDTVDNNLTITSQTLTYGNGTNPSAKTVYRGETNKAMDTFTLSVNGGSATVTQIVVTGTAGGGAANSAAVASGVKIYQDNGSTANEWDSGDTLIASTTFATNTATFSGLSIPVTTASVSYIVTADIATNATAAHTLTAQLSGMTSTANTNTDSDTGGSTLTVGAAQTTTAGNGTNPAAKTVYRGETNKAMDTFTLAVNAGTTTVTQIVVTGTAGGGAANSAAVASGVKIYQDNGSTANEWDSGDTLIASTTFATNTATFSGLSIPVTTASVSYIVTADITTNATAAHTLTAQISALTSYAQTNTDSDTGGSTLTVGAAQTTTAGNGAAQPSNKTVYRGEANKAMDTFTLAVNAGTTTVTQIVVTGTAGGGAANSAAVASGVKIYQDNGSTANEWDSGDTLIASTTFATNTATFSGLSIPVTTASVSYIVTADITTNATAAHTLTAQISALTSYAQTNTDSDTGGSTLTVGSITLTVGEGTNPSSRVVLQGNTNEGVGAFTLQTSAGTTSVSGIVITGTNPSNVQSGGVKLWEDNGTVGTWDGADVQVGSGVTFSGTTATFSGLTVQPTTSLKNYIVTYNINEKATIAQTVTGYISGITTIANTTTNNDNNADATLTIKGSSVTVSCAGCHAYPPLDGTRSGATGAVVGDHQPHNYICSTCHVTPATQTSADFAHRNENVQMNASISGGTYSRGTSFAQTNSPTTGTCSTISCHGGNNPTPQWGVGTADCTACHNGAVGTRRAIMSEFSATWNHSAADKYDCGVCHMEGAVSGSQTTGNTDSAYHGNGTIELRDPNTGTTMEGVTWGGANEGSYTSTGSALSFTQFSRNLNTSTLEAPVAAITINHCLHCHDSNGSAVYVPGGSATNPFASGVAPLNVDAQFNTANASYHPIKGKQNNSYADIDTLVAPWYQTSKTAATTTQWGDLMSCFDCHAASAAAGTQTSTVVAHGGATTLRALYNAVNDQPTALCVVCHKQSVYWTTYIHSATNSAPGNGVSGFAYATDPDGYTSYHDFSNQGFYYGCTVCHGTTGNFTTQTPTMPARPEGATNAHGFDTPNWPSGTRPYSFIRYATFVNNVKFTDWATGASAGCNGTNMCNDGRGPYTYGPGGTY